ncbi:hypothetical protein AU082_06465 [Yersinia pestis]|nr:hypothetical protein AU082_06465 [Yersinia pestis]
MKIMLIAKAKSWFRVIYPSPFKIDFGFWVIEGISRGSQKEKLAVAAFATHCQSLLFQHFIFQKLI